MKPDPINAEIEVVIQKLYVEALKNTPGTTQQKLQEAEGERIRLLLIREFTNN